MNLFDLTGKKAIVTGAATGLGRGMAEGLHGAGAEVLIVDVQSKGEQTARDMAAQGGAPVHFLQADLSELRELDAIFEKALAMLGGDVDILVNSAGIQYRDKCEDFPLDEWQRVLDVNLTAGFRLCQLAAKVMLKKGRGKIINVASMLSYFGGFTVPAYAASKGGVAQMTKAMSNEWAGRGLNINAIAPGYMDTDLNVALVNNPDRNEKILARIPAGRWGKPDDLAGIAVFLASAASDYMNGAVVPMDGGYLGM